jgi:ATP/maltotriose-dependent transcriptional regulator MalT
MQRPSPRLFGRGGLAAAAERTAAEPRPVILVLDDYQAVTNPDCHEQLALFIEHLSATLHLVVATRIHPPIPLARLRARGQLAAVALGGGGDLQARVASFSGSDRHVLDYLGEELLRAQPPEL